MSANYYSTFILEFINKMQKYTPNMMSGMVPQPIIPKATSLGSMSKSFSAMPKPGQQSLGGKGPMPKAAANQFTEIKKLRVPKNLVKR